MSNEQTRSQAVATLDIILTKARENFTDSLEDYLSAKKVKLTAAEKLDVDKLFADAFNSSLVAEISALLSFMLYSELNNPEIISRIVPDFLDEYQSKMECIPAELEKETRDLRSLAQKTLEFEEEKSEVVKSLTQDLAAMTEMKPLRSSFDAILLSLLGQ
jgi:hypothetical protein